MSDHRPIVNRRQLLSGVLASAATIAGGGVLAGCGNSAGTKNTAQANQGVRMPTYTPYTGVHPDLPGDAQGLLDGFLRYPDNPVPAFSGPPGKGGTVTAFVQTASPIPPALGQNPYWQELNRRLGVDLRLTIVPSGDMATKFAALVAGGDLPDIIVPALQLPNGLGAGIGNLPQWLAAKCQDLTEFLSGDAVQQYPFLANLPTEAWHQCVYNGGIYGLPVPRGIGGTLLFRRDDIFGQLGANPNPASYTEFRDVLRQIAGPKKSRWAATAGGLLSFVQQMLGAPNLWRGNGGKLTHIAETEQHKQALAEVTALVKEGLTHPDSFISNPPVKKWFNNGNILLNPDRYTAWPQYFADNIAGPGFRIGGMRPPRHDGSGFAGTFASPPTNNFTAFKKADSGRVKDLLALANWLAAPFGTAEFLLRKYGTAGVHYTMQNGGPAQTQAGITQTVLGIRYIVDAPDVIFIPGNADATRKSYEYQKSIIPTVVKDATVSLFSDTWSRKRPALDKLLSDAQNDILTGREPLSAWDDVRKTWKSTGGEAARSEFEQQLQRNGGQG
jgi:putative aldouronate transport system substrate-binding protein